MLKNQFKKKIRLQYWKTEKVKVIIAITGGRNFKPTEEHEEWLRSQLVDLQPTRVIHGGCRGADLWAAHIAYGMGIPTKEYQANWEKWGRNAGPIRNGLMAKECDVCLAFPGGKGTENMKKHCKKYNKEVRTP